MSTATAQTRAAPATTIVDVARSADDLAQALVVRSVVYVGEQNCPAGEEFDGNDFAGATHLLARHKGALAGTCRLRWFAGFAKIERVAVLTAFRSCSVAHDLIAAAKAMAAAKGYERMLAHIEPSLLAYWRRQGFAPRQGRASFHFSDRRYVEVLGALQRPADALTLESAPMVLVRPEGRWREPGVLDHSARRAVR